MDEERTCGECIYFAADESWTEDDYFWFAYCTVGLGPAFGISDDTPACNCFRPFR